MRLWREEGGRGGHVVVRVSEGERVKGPQMGRFGLCQTPEGLGATPSLRLSSECGEEPGIGSTWGMTQSNPALGPTNPSSKKQNLHRERQLACFQVQTKYTLRPEHLSHAKVPPTGDISYGSLAAGSGAGFSRGLHGHSGAVPFPGQNQSPPAQGGSSNHHGSWSFPRPGRDSADSWSSINAVKRS